MADALAQRYAVQVLTGAQVLNERVIPESDYIVTGSMGGLLAMELLPQRCRKLVLISSTAKFCACEGYACGTHERVLHRMLLQLKKNPEAVLEEFFMNVHFPHRESRQSVALRKKVPMDLIDLTAGLEYLLEADVRDQAPGIQIPVLLMHGAADRIIPAAASEWLHARLSQSFLEIIENDGHALPAHHFSIVMNRIETFLSR